MKMETLAVHAGHGPDPAHGAVMQPIYQTSIYAYEGMNQPGEYEYTRSENPTRKALQDCLAALEGAGFGFTFASGMAAETTAVQLVGRGEHMLVHNDLYGGTFLLLSEIVAKIGVDVEFLDMRDLDALRKAIRSDTRMIWTESPTNPLMNLLDLAAIAEVAREHGVLTVTDNTFLSPYFQNPLSLGIDLVSHSTTKYINGHSDVIGGALMTNDQELAEKIAYYQTATGNAQSPFDSFLVLRGVKTLAIRMEAHNRNALAIARWLEAHPSVERVLHPGLESHPQHELALRQARGFGGTFSFALKGGEEAVRRLLETTKLFTLAGSLGGVESLISQPWSMSHLVMPPKAKLQAGITPSLVRLSVGIEHVDDLIADLEQGL